MLTVSETELGTSESTWMGSSRLASLPVMQWRSPRRVVVVAPHPDDEVLGVGGSLRSLARAGAAVEVVAVTDGEASHPGSDAITPAELARVRAAESEAALSRLGLGRPRRLRLHLPDGHVSTFEEELTDQLGDLLDGDTLCLATWRGDGHPDHEAVGRAAGRASLRRKARFVEFPVWAWHWASPAASDPAGLPWPRAHRHVLDDAGWQAKASAIAAFASQTTRVGPDPADRAVLPGPVLQRFRRRFEVLFEGPDTPSDPPLPDVPRASEVAPTDD